MSLRLHRHTVSRVRMIAAGGERLLRASPVPSPAPSPVLSRVTADANIRECQENIKNKYPWTLQECPIPVVTLGSALCLSNQLLHQVVTCACACKKKQPYKLGRIFLLKITVCQYLVEGLTLASIKLSI